MSDSTSLFYYLRVQIYQTRVELLVFHRMPPLVDGQGKAHQIWWVLGKYTIPRVEQNQHHCFVENVRLQLLGEGTLKENQPAQKFI